MSPTNKQMLRAAVLVHAQLDGGKRPGGPLYLPEYSWNSIQRLRRQIDLARQHGWHGAARRLTEEMSAAMDDCRRNLENAIRALPCRSAERRSSSAADIYRDLLALDDEFEEVVIDLQQHELCVTTDRIVLDHVNLGCFDIRLDWQSSYDAQPYRVVALDPNPAAGNDDVTHPHVRGEQLCEGEGRAAIAAALAECRLYDFYLLVSQLLHTYGSGSAYVELDNWDGIPCQDCGESLSEDDRYYCNRCESRLCESCAHPCNGCDESYCSGCLSPCAACGCEYCSSCLATCPGCRKQFCSDCRDERTGLCDCCREKQRQKETEHDPSQIDADSKPAGRVRTRRRRSAAQVSA